MSDVIELAGRRPCGACQAHKHNSCWQKLADLRDRDEPCLCGCWDGQNTSTEALADAMKHHPELMAAVMQFRSATFWVCESVTASS